MVEGWDTTTFKQEIKFDSRAEADTSLGYT